MENEPSLASPLSCLREDAAGARPVMSCGAGAVLAVSAIAWHEAGHCVVARYLGMPIGGATIVPSGDFGGLTFPPGTDRLNVTGAAIREEAERQCDDARGLMPPAGERRDCAASWAVHAQSRVIDCLAGFASEQLAGYEREGEAGSSDVMVAKLYARSFVMSDTAVDGFVASCRADAIKILRDHWQAVEAVALALDEKQMLDGVEIDAIIYQSESKAAHEAELRRRESMTAMTAKAKSK
jgi:hypothetical protein